MTTDGVIVDGHHAVRAAAETGRTVDVLVSPLPVLATAESTWDLMIR